MDQRSRRAQKNEQQLTNIAKTQIIGAIKIIS